MRSRRSLIALASAALATAIALVSCGEDEPATPMPRLLSPPDLPPPPANEQCRPAGGPIAWVLEGDAINARVTCALGGTPSAGAFELPELPPGATYDASAGVLSWRPALDQAGLWHVPVFVPALGESGVLRIGVVENWDAPGNVTVRWPLGYPEEYGLPVVHLEWSGRRSEEYLPVRLVHRGRAWNAKFKYRGQTSLKYPKKNFTVDVGKADPFVEPDFAGGFVRPEFVLTGNFDDTSHVRQRLAYDLWNRLDPAHVPVKTFSVVLYLNGHYWGLYTLGDHVDKHLLKPNGISKDANIYKAVSGYANLRSVDLDGRPKPYLWYGVEKKEGEPPQGVPGAFDDYEALIRFLEGAGADELRRRVPELIRLDDFAHWWQLGLFGLTTDSVLNNVYFIHDPTRGPWRCIPWDFNASFGQNNATARTRADHPTEFLRANAMFERLLGEPSFRLREGLGEALQGPFALNEVLALVDSYEREIDVSARRDWQRWGRAHMSYYGRGSEASYERELAYVRQWIRERWDDLHRRYGAPVNSAQ